MLKLRNQGPAGSGWSCLEVSQNDDDELSFCIARPDGIREGKSAVVNRATVRDLAKRLLKWAGDEEPSGVEGEL